MSAIETGVVRVVILYVIMVELVLFGASDFCDICAVGGWHVLGFWLMLCFEGDGVVVDFERVFKIIGVFPFESIILPVVRIWLYFYERLWLDLISEFANILGPAFSFLFILVVFPVVGGDAYVFV